MSVLAPPAMPLLPPISILNRTGVVVSAHRTPGLLTLSKPVPAAPKSTRRVVSRTAKSVAPPSSSSSSVAVVVSAAPSKVLAASAARPTTPVNIPVFNNSKAGVFATPPATPDPRVVRSKTPPSPTPVPRHVPAAPQMQMPTPNPSPTLASAAPVAQNSPGRLARNRRTKHKTNPSLVLEMPPLPAMPAPVPVPSSRTTIAPTHINTRANPMLSRSEPLPASYRLYHPTAPVATARTTTTTPNRRRDILPLSDWDLPASPTDAGFDFWADSTNEPQTAPLTGRSKPRSRPVVISESHSDSETTVRPIRQHVRSPSLPLDGMFNMSLSDEENDALADAKKILYAGPKFNNSPHPKNLPGAAFF